MYHVPTVVELHKRVIMVASQLRRYHNVDLLEINVAPILSRFVRELMLPPTFYVAVKSLLTFLRIDMHVLGHTVIPPNPQVRAKFLERHGTDGLPTAYAFSRNLAVPRCVVLMAALIVVIKLRYGLDDIHRKETSTTLQGRQVFSGAPPQEEVWIDALCFLHGLPSDRAWEAKPPTFAPWDASVDLLSLNDADIDTYLTFLEQEYLPSNVPSSMPFRHRNDVDDLLPIPVPSQEPLDLVERVRNMQEVFQQRRAELLCAMYQSEEKEPGIQPGEAYATHTHDPGGAMTRSMERMLAIGMRVVGLDTQVKPTFESVAAHPSRPRENDVLKHCVMQLEESLLLMLMREHGK
ncbi:hypothetical protein MNAN1_002100 [Malassezia nana]|uniref:Rrn7/TAF1B C-terminal cyclin domain-containing protein n=1 Tax=Malassezia nana TaxID=180528 RepID=A0AAF0EM63_9BASI|nr:hypothetical protein MNAN1_002100 [Malassezia nana]